MAGRKLNPPIVIAIVIALAFVAGAGFLLLQAPSSQVAPVTQTSRTPSSSQAEFVQAGQIMGSPSSYQGKLVEVEGTLTKDFLLARPYLLDDGTSSISLQPNTDMDKYVGLKIRVSGIVRYDPGAFNLPSTSIEVQSAKPLEEPAFYIEMSKNGRDEGGRPTLSRVLVYDNSGKLTVYSSVAKKVLLQATLTKERMEQIRKKFLDADVFNIQQEEYRPRSHVVPVPDYQTFTATYTLKVILKIGNELKESKLQWPEPAEVPDKILKLQQAFNDILLADSP